MKVILEAFFTKIKDRSIIYWKDEIDISDKDTNPDDEINEAIISETHKTPQFIKDDFIVHSTSWRYEFNGSIVLTYIIFSDHLDFQNAETKTLMVENISIASNNDIKKPRPDIITEENIIYHAIRHLNFLINHDTSGKYADILSSNTKAVLNLSGQDLAGKLGTFRSNVTI